MTNPKQLLSQYGIFPRKKWGQNFLYDPNTLAKIADTAELTPEDIVLEIGPGTGTLTKVLAERARQVFSVEIDERFLPILEDELVDYDNVELILDDFLKVDVLDLVGDNDFVVVANVPYYITSAILRHLLQSPRPPRRLVMTVQYELAERMLEQPPRMNLLAVSVQFFGKPEIITRLKPDVFWPRPAIDSAVIKIDTYDQPVIPLPSVKQFFRVVRAGFGQKRKQLKNSLGSGLGIKAKAAGELLEEAGIDPKRRAETVTLEEWATLTRVVAGKSS
jgi:16S rRNA (adenine1518-N6/adenine1519-N6)-dimethyltransferase